MYYQFLNILVFNMFIDDTKTWGTPSGRGRGVRSTLLHMNSKKMHEKSSFLKITRDDPR